MLILTIKTDSTISELALYQDNKKKNSLLWESHKTLAKTIFTKIDELLAGHKRVLSDVEGIVCYRGPGSFTGLRIGLTVANSIAYGLSIPVVSAKGNNWQRQGIIRMQAGENEKIALPEYGSEPNVSKPVK